MQRKFKPGDLVACVDGYGCAQAGGTATVTGYQGGYLYVVWNVHDGRTGGQGNGGYQEHRFEKIAPTAFLGEGIDPLAQELIDDYLRS